MSLILEALRKSEAERRRGQAPGLFVEQVRLPARRRDGTPAWAWIVMLLLAGVLSAWGSREFGARAPGATDIAANRASTDGSAVSRPMAPPVSGDTQSTAGGKALPDAAPHAANAPVAATGASGYGPADLPAGGDQRGDARQGPPDPAHDASFPNTPSPRDLATSPRGTQSVATTASKGPDPTPAAAVAANREPVSASAATGLAAREAGDPSATAGDAQNIPATAPATVATSAEASAAPSVAPAPIPEDDYLPRLSELTGDERSGLPALKLSMHVYADDPAQRFVIVDGRRLREGDSPAAGIAVEAIRRDGLVLSVNGRRVLLARP